MWRWILRVLGALVLVFVIALGVSVHRRRAKIKHLSEVLPYDAPGFRFNVPRFEWGLVVLNYYEADSLKRQIEERLGACGDQVIEIEVPSALAGSFLPVAGHTLGRKIILNCGPHAHTRRTLVHELVHVCFNHLSDEVDRRHGPWTRTFNEGLAEFLADDLASSDAAPFRAPLLAWMSMIRRPSASEVLDSVGPVTDYGNSARYPFGQLLVQAIVQVHGEPILSAIARAIPTVEQRLPAHDSELLHQSLRLAGVDWARVELEFEVLLHGAITEGEVQLQALPPLVGAFEREEQVLWWRPAQPTPNGYMLFCNVRPLNEPSGSVQIVPDCGLREAYLLRVPSEIQFCWARINGEADFCTPYAAVSLSPAQPIAP